MIVEVPLADLVKTLNRIARPGLSTNIVCWRHQSVVKALDTYADGAEKVEYTGLGMRVVRDGAVVLALANADIKVLPRASHLIIVDGEELPTRLLQRLRHSD